jgi:hypothetical protein
MLSEDQLLIVQAVLVWTLPITSTACVLQRATLWTTIVFRKDIAGMVDTVAVWTLPVTELAASLAAHGCSLCVVLNGWRRSEHAFAARGIYVSRRWLVHHQWRWATEKAWPASELAFAATMSAIRPRRTAFWARRFAAKDVAPAIYTSLVRALPVAFPLSILAGATRRTGVMLTEDHLCVVDTISVGALPVVWPNFFGGTTAERLGRHYTISRRRHTVLRDGHIAAATIRSTTINATVSRLGITTEVIPSAKGATATAFRCTAFGALAVTAEDKLRVVNAGDIWALPIAGLLTTIRLSAGLWRPTLRALVVLSKDHV